MAIDPETDTPNIRMQALRRIGDLVNQSVTFSLIAANVDRPDAEKYGTHPDGSPRYAPEWYMAQDISTGIHEGLFGALSDVLRCLSLDEEGRWCIGSIMHDGWHHDGNGANW